MIPPLVHDSEGSRRREVVLERGAEALPGARRGGLIWVSEDLPEALGAGGGLLHHLVLEVDRLAPGPGEMEDEERLATPHVKDVAKGDDVAERLRHLRLAEL